MKKSKAIAAGILVAAILTLTAVYALDEPAKNMISAGNHFYNKSVDLKESVYDYNQDLRAEEALTVPISGAGVFDPFSQYQGVYGDIQHGAVLTNNFTFYLRAQFLGIGEDSGYMSYNGIYHVSNTLYFPLVSTIGDWNSTLYYFNTGDSSAETWVYCYNSDGSLESSWKENENPGQRERDGISINLDEWEGSVVVTSTQPLASVIAITNEDVSSMAYRGNAQPLNDFYLPLIYDGQSDWSSDIRIQNASGGTQQVAISYYDASGSHVATLTNAVVENGSYHPAIPPGAASAVIGGDDILAVAVANENQSGTLWGYEGGRPRYAPLLPLLMKNANGFNSSFTIQNPNDFTCQVSWQYFNQDGTNASASSSAHNVPVNGAYTVDLENDATIAGTDSFMGLARVSVTGSSTGSGYQSAIAVKHVNTDGVAGTIYTDNFVPLDKRKLAASDPWDDANKYYFPIIYGTSTEEEAVEDIPPYYGASSPMLCFVETLRD